MPRSYLLTEEHLPKLRHAAQTQTVTALSSSYGVSISTMSRFLRKHGVLAQYDGWPQERYDRLLSTAAQHATLAQSAALAGTNTAEAKVRLDQLLSTFRKVGINLSQLAIVTGIDRTYWRQYIHEGLVSAVRTGRSERVHVAELVRAVGALPELFDYRAVPQHLAEPLGLRVLPDPPLFKLVTCRSSSIESRLVEIPADEADQDLSSIRYEVKSCEAIGGLDLWAPMYAATTCPRCGLRVSRFSEKQTYANEPGDGGPVKDAMATKVGLRWKNERFETSDGRALDSHALAVYIKRIAQRNRREHERKLKLVADIEHYKVVANPEIL